MSFFDYVSKINGVCPLVPKYHLLDIINKTYDENIISNWLAFFLNPVKCGSAAPLNSFANRFGLKIESEDVEVIREYFLESKGRIDIVVKAKNIWLVIENKINSKENNNQTEDYYNCIKKEAPTTQIAYIFLKPDYNKFNRKCGFFEIFKYSELLKLWRNISESDFMDREYYVYFNTLLKIIERELRNE